MNEYYCDYCNLTTTKKTNFDRHNKTAKHIKLKKSHDDAIRDIREQVIVLAPIIPAIPPPVINDRRAFKQQIIQLAELYRLNGVNLNNYFLYEYYYKNFNELDNYDLMDLYQELESRKHLIKDFNQEY